MAIKFSELGDNQIVLFLAPAQKYMDTNMEILDYYVNKKDLNCVYITVTRPYTSLLQILNKNKINTNKFFVVDAITPVSSQQMTDKAIFVGSPQGLTNISIAASSAMDKIPKGKRMLFLDSVSTLMVYNDFGTVAKFTHFIITKMREWNIGGAIISLEKELDEKMLSQLSQFCDKVIEVK